MKAQPSLLGFQSMSLALLSYLVLYDLKTWLFVSPLPGGPPTIIVPAAIYISLAIAIVLPKAQPWARLAVYVTASIIIIGRLFSAVPPLIYWLLPTEIKRAHDLSGYTFWRGLVESMPDLLTVAIVGCAAREVRNTAKRQKAGNSIS